VVKNCAKIEGKILPSDICQKCDIYWQKNMLLVSVKLEILHARKLPRAGKITPKLFFTGASNIVKMEPKIYKYSQNICQIF